MRMTNKIMQANSLYNINQTKLQEDKYNTQLTSQSKITRPSDDPVIAIRALRLRSNVSTVTQYYEKNTPDANQWLDVTAQSLNTITSVLTNLYNQVQTGVNKDYTASDMEVLLTQVEAYTHEMYATGNQDYAGRYIFAGYRTDTALTMDKNNLDQYFKIKENITDAKFDSFSYTDYSVFDVTTTAENAKEQQITNATLHRMRLSYNKLGDTLPTITVKPPEGQTAPTIPTITSYATPEDAYKAMTANEQNDPATPAAYFIASTGELLLDSDTAEKLHNMMADGGTVDITYEKSTWSDEDLNPVHYFECWDNADPAQAIHYNEDGKVDTQITYDVGYNQTIQVNTNAYEVFDPALSRDYDDMKYLIAQFKEVETLRLKYQSELDKIEPSDKTNYVPAKNRYDAIDKAYTYVRDAVSKRFGNQITRYQNYLDATNVAITKNGTRSTRLELIGARLTEQKSTFKELQEENEGIDMTEVAVKLTAAETTYDAALMATSKIMQNSLINYI